MNILLVGEFSYFHRYLQIGLKELGHNVLVAGSSEGFKNLIVDIYLEKPVQNPNFLTKAIKQIELLKISKQLKNYDIIQFISPFLFINKIPFYNHYFNKYIYKTIIKNNRNYFLAVCGSDALSRQVGKKFLDYSCYDRETRKSYLWQKKALKWNIDLINNSNGVIPTTWEYFIGIDQEERIIREKISPVIPMPINCKEFNYKDNIVGDRIRILHIKTRAEKGSAIIVQALQEAQELFPNDIEIIIKERVSYNDFLKEVSETNVIIDQAFSYGYGITALISMALGKIVFSGAETETIKAIGLTESPVVNIKPNTKGIIKEIEKIINNRSNIVHQGLLSRQFVENYHDSTVVAKRYLDFWEKQIKCI